MFHSNDALKPVINTPDKLLRMKKALSIMKAIRVTQFGGPEVLKVASDVAIPKPTGTQLLVNVKAAGVNPVDTYIRSGTYGSAMNPDLPYTPGKDGAGIITSIGDNVSKFKIGQRVYFRGSVSGSYAEFALVDQSTAGSLYDNLSFGQGAAIGIAYYTAYRAVVHKGAVKAGQTVLVHGASGAVGIACCQIAHTLGATVLGTAGTGDGEKLVKENRASLVFNHREENYTEKIREATGGKGVDVIVEMLANVNLEKDLTLCARNGRVVIVGSRGSIEITPRLTMNAESSITGLLAGKATQEELDETDAFLAAGQDIGWLQPVVGEEYTLEGASEAHKEVIAHTRGSRGKIIINTENVPSDVPL